MAATLGPSLFALGGGATLNTSCIRDGDSPLRLYSTSAMTRMHAG